TWLISPFWRASNPKSRSREGSIGRGMIVGSPACCPRRTILARSHTGFRDKKWRRVAAILPSHLLRELFEGPQEQVRTRRLDAEPLELGRDLAAVVGRMIHQVSQHDPRRQDRDPAAAPERPRRGELLRRQGGYDVAEDLISPIQEALGVVDGREVCLR